MAIINDGGSGSTSRRPPSRSTPTGGYNQYGNTSAPTAPPGWDAAIGAVQDAALGMVQPGGNAGADKAQALKDIDIARRELTFQEKVGLRDIGQDQEQGLRAAQNNALQRGIYRSGIRIENENLVNREAGEATSDLRQQIAFALERLANREANIHAGGSSGGGMGGGSGINPGDFLQIISRLMGGLTEYGAYQAPPPPRTPGDYRGDLVTQPGSGIAGRQ